MESWVGCSEFKISYKLQTSNSKLSLFLLFDDHFPYLVLVITGK